MRTLIFPIDTFGRSRGYGIGLKGQPSSINTYCVYKELEMDVFSLAMIMYWKGNPPTPSDIPPTEPLRVAPKYTYTQLMKMVRNYGRD